MESAQEPDAAEATARRLVQTHGPRLFALALRLCAAPADAEDLVFRTLERALLRLDRYRPVDDPAAWLRTILLNLWRNDRRAAASRPAAPPPDGGATAADLPDPGPTPAEQAAARADAEAARRAVAALPPRLRAPVALHYFEGLDVAETARELRIPAGTVKFRLFEARRRLKRMLKDWSVP